MTTGIYPRAIWKPVPSFGYPPGTHGQLRANHCRKAFCHDAQGWAHGALARFSDPANKGSAHAIINFEGPPWQFINFDDAAWHAGGYIPSLGEFANLFAWGIEFEGGYPTPTPITDYQVEQALALFRWLSTEYDFVWAAARRVDLWEHREVYPTSCPSDRIRWPEIFAGLKEDNMTDPLNVEWIRGKIRIQSKLFHLAAAYRDHPDQPLDEEAEAWLDLAPEVHSRAESFPALRPTREQCQRWTADPQTPA